MSRRQFSAVSTEGGLLPQDLLARVQAGDSTLHGTKAETYHLGPHERIGEAVNRSWTRLLATWHAFQEALEKVPESSLATGLTRERWLLPLFQELGYGRLPKGSAIEVDGRTYAVSHTWHHSPLHLLGSRVDLDRRQKGVAGAAKSSPHGLVQEFLNRSDDHLWGFVTNGYQLRVLRDHHSLTRQAYVEFDLQAIMDGEQYSEFMLLWLVCHQSRVEADKPQDCWLEKWHALSAEEGVRALDKLRGGVEKAIEAFGAGFLASKANVRLHEALASGERDAQEYYRQVLRLVYRLIFLFVAEERDALLDPDAAEEAKERYRRYYATRRLRELADKRRGGPHGDLWRGLALVMTQLDKGYAPLALPALGSRLWGQTACPWLMDAECDNEHVLSAVRQLSHIQDGKTRYPVNWRNVGADELGSVYEGLLELHPRLHVEAGTFKLDTAAGHERKTTGSYYTPTSLVDCLLDSALDPALDEAAKKGPDAILALKVCDPACGSGHFLVAAARRIAKRLASVRSGDDEPSPRDVQRALRDVVGRCVYGVDVNPMAVELCKVSLWMEAIEPGRPLSFLDSHIQCGNALLGTTPALMARGIPNDAFKPIEGDDKEVAKRLKKRNRKERKTKQDRLPFMRAEDKQVFDEFVACDLGPDFDLASVREQETCWVNLNRSRAFRDAKFLADAWCAAFVWPKQPGEKEAAAVTQDLWRRMQRDIVAAPRTTRQIVRELARKYQFFHWHLAFPAVFGEANAKFEKGETTGWAGGFDVVLGNPPWERIKVQEKEWFAGRSEPIAEASKAADRQALIERLAVVDPALFCTWRQAMRDAESVGQLLRSSGRFPNSSSGDLNTYPCFTESASQLVAERGAAGLILPQGIVTDKDYSGPFRALMRARRLLRVAGFVNERGLFPGVMHNVKFAVFVFAGRDDSCLDALFSLNSETLEEASDPSRQYRLTAADINNVNPDSGTCPVFRSGTDAALIRDLYRRCPTLAASDWGISYGKTLHMGSASSAFRDRGAGLVPVYESKMIGQYNHRRCSFEHLPPGQRAHILPEAPPSSLADPVYRSSTCYEVAAHDIGTAKTDEWSFPWHVAYRRITSLEVDRTVELAILPDVGMSDSLMVLRFAGAGAKQRALLFVALANSFPFDYVVRTKLGGRNLSQYVFNQVAVPEYRQVTSLLPSVSEFIVRAVLELSYVSWDLEPLAMDIGYLGAPFKWNPTRRYAIARELDALFFHLYGFSRDEVTHALESFWVVRDQDMRMHGDYRTKSHILDIYDRMCRVIDTGRPYQTIVDPPPAHPSLAHDESTRPSWAEPPATLPAVPARPPTVDPQVEPVFVSWALLRQRGDSMACADLARAFALRSAPDLLLRLATADLAQRAQQWAQRVGTRSVAPGTLARTLRALVERDGIRLATESDGSIVLEATSHTPAADGIDAWYLFEAQLALAVLDALPAESVGDVDGSLSGEDSQLLAGGA